MNSSIVSEFGSDVFPFKFGSLEFDSEKFGSQPCREITKFSYVFRLNTFSFKLNNVLVTNFEYYLYDKIIKSVKEPTKIPEISAF